MVSSNAPDPINAFAGTSQAEGLSTYGGDQDVVPPNEDIAVGPSDLIEVVNSTLYVYNRAGAVLGHADLNSFMEVEPGFRSSDPRVIYDTGSQRFWVTVTEVPETGCPTAAPVIIAVSASSNPLPFSGWLVYGLTVETPGTVVADQPGLGISSNTVAVTFDDYDCSGNFISSEMDILQKVDYEHDSGTISEYFFTDGPPAPQPVQSFGSTAIQYVVTNESDCGIPACTSPEVEVDAFTGTPEGAGGVNVTASFPAMTATAVNDSTFFLPPADQEGTTQTLQTNDDRFLNAVWENGTIWTADGTSCQPSGDIVQRDCLNYVGIAASNTGIVNPTITQIDNFGIDGEDLFYPAVSLDSSGDMITVFDESSTTMYPTIATADVPSGGSTLSPIQTVHQSATYYDATDLFPEACDANGCRWGDYSGAAQDPADPHDVWVVSGAEDGTTSSACTSAHACWNTDIADVTLAVPSITSLSPSFGPVVGGQTVTVSGLHFGSDTTVTFGGATIPISNLTSNSFTFVTPPGPASGMVDQVQATDAEGSSVENAASAFTYIGLSNYKPLNPFRILDTRPATCIQCTGGALGQGAVRTLQVTGFGGTPVPSDATAVVLNVTEVNGTAGSLLTLYPTGTSRPNASNLNFPAHTTIPNLVTVTLGMLGRVDIYNAVGTVNVTADVAGYFVPDVATDFNGLFHPMAPLRVCDTRTSCEGNVALRANRSIRLDVTAGGGIPNDGTAGSAVLNLTGVTGTAATFLSVFPTNTSGGCTFPGTANLNLAAGAVEANRVMVRLGPATTGGPATSVCLYNAVGTINVVVDVNGWFGSSTATATPTGYQYQAVTPSRICDTRYGSSNCTKGAIGQRVSKLIGIAGDGGVPATTSGTTVVALIGNLTAVLPSQSTYLVLYPGNLTGSSSSDINVKAGVTLPNLVVVALDTTADARDGDVYVYNNVGSVNVTLDVEGWFQ